MGDEGGATGTYLRSAVPIRVHREPPGRDSECVETLDNTQFC